MCIDFYKFKVKEQLAQCPGIKNIKVVKHK